MRYLDRQGRTRSCGDSVRRGWWAVELVRLLTFGGLTLQTGSATMTGASTRRHRLAVLALLAVARNRGLSRDKLQAYLWPESDAEHARHGLNQLLYFQRRHLNGGGLYLGRKTLRLNPAVITSDVWEFEDALDAGAYESAIRLYAGPFLDGFFVRGVPDFEQWIEDQRRRFQQRCVEAVTTLARSAAAAGDHCRALVWWRRAAELNPFDAETVRQMVAASLAIGDRATAIGAAHQYADLLRTELGIAPDPEVMRLVDQMRSSIG
jgi:DNA-binding SARP family transcriptional activator